MRQVDDARSAVASRERRGASVGSAELFSTVFVTGAMVMTIEIVGTRIVGPVFGVGLFVWSALLAVTLGALAFGYFTGGLMADRIPSSRLRTCGRVGSPVPSASAPEIPLSAAARGHADRGDDHAQRA